MKKLLPALLFCNLINAQQYSQIVRGRILNASSQMPVSTASVNFYGSAGYKAVSDSLGYYNVSVAPGKYNIYIQQEGFRPAMRENIAVLTGKQQIQDFELSPFRMDLDTVTIKAAQNENVVGVNLWNIQQFAAVFYDPARVAYTHSGIMNIDDGTNQSTVRGSSPNYIQWKLEDVEIVNPNHLENAGTFNDRPTLNGGGVCIISAQLLQNSEFKFAPFDPASGNVLSGLFDMKLRKGNDERREYVVQASLLGIDLAMEGPFSKKSKASYLLNFRYSTIGLLSKMGVDFGNEKINYLDLSHMINIPYKRGTFKIFGMTGNSETIFRGQQDSLKVETEKDLQDIDYHSLTTINGLSNVVGVGSGMFIKSVAAWSTKDVSRSSIPSSPSWVQAQNDHDSFSQDKFSTLNYFSKKFNNVLEMKTGLHLNYFMYKMESRSEGGWNVKRELADPVVQPFVSADIRISSRLEVTAGLHSQYLSRINYFSLQPRCVVKLFLSTTQSLRFAYGTSSQVQPFFLLLSNDFNRNLKPVENQAFSLSHLANLKWLSLKTEVYYQIYSGIPEQNAYGFSSFNYFNELVFFPLEQKGKAEVYGIDLRLEKNYKNFYMIASGSLYNSVYSIPGTNMIPSRFNTGYGCFLTGGKETKLKNKDNFLSVDLRGVLRNGFKEPEGLLDPVQYDYDIQLPEYWRIDLRISYKKNKKNSTVIWALDIQNITNRRNVSYHYLDSFTGKVETKYQLGLIPVLSYKVMF